MKNKLIPKGDLINVNGHNIHIYRIGDTSKPKIVLMSGSGTVAPIYDFKVLYQKLAQHFRVIVVEKFGYGYSDIFDSPGDIDSLVDIDRQALMASGEPGPYILMPHSMSGLEALRFAQRYPDEVAAIIGNDMATPLSYSAWTDKQVDKKLKLMERLKRYRLYPFFCPISNLELTKEELHQHKLLRARNAFNICCVNESKHVLKNAQIVDAACYPSCPALLFCSNGKPRTEHWTNSMKKLSDIMNAKLVTFDCGHYIHQFKSEEMCAKIVSFVKSLNG